MNFARLCKSAAGSLSSCTGVVSDGLPSQFYYRLYRPDSLGNEYQSKNKIWKQAAWATMFTALLDGAIPICRTPEERLLMQQAILWQVIAYPHFHPNRESSSSATLIAECLKRLSYEGNTHLLSQEEFLTIMERLNWSRR